MTEKDLARFFDRVSFIPGGCWEWRGSRRGNGYGSFKQEYAHRWSYRAFVGEIPVGLELDHLCRNRMCVNSDHLEPVTRHENIMRGLNPIVQRARHARTTHCPQGHPYDRANTYQRHDRPEGGRACKTCQYTRNRERRLAQRK